MSKTSGNKFKTKFNFVKPLYRKARISDCKNIDNSGNPYNFDRTVKLCGDDFNVKTVIAAGANVNNKHRLKKDYKVVLPGVCDSVRSVDGLKHLKVIDILRPQRNNYNNVKRNTNLKTCANKMLENIQDNKVFKDDTRIRESRMNNPETIEGTLGVHKLPETWLRVYPAPKLSEETVYSTVLRCVLCQLGLITFLVLWTVLWVFVIQSFEGPQEIVISTDFEKEQNQLVIDLATELRQILTNVLYLRTCFIYQLNPFFKNISARHTVDGSQYEDRQTLTRLTLQMKSLAMITPLSPKWRNAIERRIEDERKLTIAAVGAGARLQPGQFWNLPGTFLFAVYVMTALGFGAPVPHTLWGRSSALIYALLAVPTHIYLMVNASTCVAIRVERYTKYLKENNHGNIDVTNDENRQGSNRSSELIKSSNKLSLRKNINRCVSILTAGRCIPLASITYYLVGVISFGVLRNKPAFESIMFPVEFTTTGGLDGVEGFVRIFYGIYIEGAMCLFACALATLRRHNSSTFDDFSRTYRLFDCDSCKKCVTDRKEEFNRIS